MPAPSGRSRRTAIAEAGALLYWDASAILSVLIRDANSEQATAAAQAPSTHLLSTLAYAEVVAVLARLEREGALSSHVGESARSVVESGPWRRLGLQPDWSEIDELARRWPLRGADLWHLATVVTLRRELPELRLLTFDARLVAASRGLGLA